MPQIQATPGSNITISGNVNVQSKTTFTVTGSVIGTTEDTIVIPAGTKTFRLQTAPSAGGASLTISHTVGGTSVTATSFNICAGDRWSEELLDETGFTIYLKSSKAATDVQVILWT